MALFDLKSLNSAFEELQQERGISRESVIDALATALAAAYRREYGKRGQIIRATFNPETGDLEFRQAKIVVDATLVRQEGEEATGGDDHRSRFNPEQHIMIEDARRIKRDAVLDEEISFPLETREDFVKALPLLPRHRGAGIVESNNQRSHVLPRDTYVQRALTTAPASIQRRVETPRPQMFSQYAAVP